MGQVMPCVVIEQGKMGVLETLGKYSRNLNPGLNCVVPCFQNLHYVYDMRQSQIKIDVSTKTHDNVFCNVEIAIFYNLKANEVQAFAYHIQEFRDMIESVVMDQVRSILCKVTLDESFETKQEITSIIKDSLDANFGGFGLNFTSVIVNDIVPDKNVREAMNEINRQARLRVAVESEADAKKTQLIKAAEAEAEAKKLSGIGLAEQRKAIVDGLTSSISNFVENVDINPQQVMQIVMMNQYFDTLKELGANQKSSCVFVPNNPDHSDQINQQIISASLINPPPKFKHRGGPSSRPSPLSTLNAVQG